MKEKKRQIVRCSFYDQTAMQKQFEKMAAQGWLIEKLGTYFWTYRRNHVKGGLNGPKDLAYTIADIKWPFLYDTIKQAMLKERQDEVYDDHIFINHYEPIDAAPWKALNAYQLHWSDSILNTYLICWEDRIVELKFYWEPTPEQIEIAAKKLKEK